MRASFYRLSLKCGPGFPWQNRVFLRQIWNGVSLLWQPYLCIGQSTQTVAPPGRTGFWWYSHHFFPRSDTASALKNLRDTWGNQTAKHISGALTLNSGIMGSPHALNVAEEQSPALGESTSGGRAKESVMLRGHRMPDTQCCVREWGLWGCRWGEPRGPEEQSWRGRILGISVVFMTLSSLHLRFLAHSGSVLTNKLNNMARVSCKGLSEAQRIETWVGKVLSGDVWDRLAAKLSSC